MRFVKRLFEATVYVRVRTQIAFLKYLQGKCRKLSIYQILRKEMEESRFFLVAVNRGHFITDGT